MKIKFLCILSLENCLKPEELLRIHTLMASEFRMVFFLDIHQAVNNACRSLTKTDLILDQDLKI